LPLAEANYTVKLTWKREEKQKPQPRRGTSRHPGQVWWRHRRSGRKPAQRI